LMPRRPGWTDKFLHFLRVLQTLEQSTKKCSDIRGECFE
jgi:hypothetical protein